MYCQISTGADTTFWGLASPRRDRDYKQSPETGIAENQALVSVSAIPLADTQIIFSETETFPKMTRDFAMPPETQNFGADTQIYSIGNLQRYFP